MELNALMKFQKGIIYTMKHLKQCTNVMINAKIVHMKVLRIIPVFHAIIKMVIIKY